MFTADPPGYSDQDAYNHLRHQMADNRETKPRAILSAPRTRTTGMTKAGRDAYFRRQQQVQRR